jgi:glycosyltransferase involved in cell wall biosynthesis
MGGARVLDCLAKGLGELGHTVFYIVRHRASPPPAGVQFVHTPPPDIHIIHARDDQAFERLHIRHTPWVRTCHVDVRLHGLDLAVAQRNWIYVSRTLAQTYGSDRYVLNGIDPSEHVYSERKRNYFLFVCAAERARAKGLELAARISRITGVPLIVAGSSPNRELVREIAAFCRRSGCRYVREVHGPRKARLFAEAKALLFPTQWNESFGLVIAEALMSGTPVISSSRGACPELVSPDVGFVCETESDYLQAVASLARISPSSCRRKAMRDFHYRRMASDYVRIYEDFIRSHAA